MMMMTAESVMAMAVRVSVMLVMVVILINDGGDGGDGDGGSTIPERQIWSPKSKGSWREGKAGRRGHLILAMP